MVKDWINILVEEQERRVGFSLISRSQAKRVLEGLDKYKRIVFDFKGIELVGQAFADEIFRVFRRNHPEVVLEPINMNEAVRMMVERAMNDEMWG